MRWLVAAFGLLTLLVFASIAAVQLQHLAWSTALVENADTAATGNIAIFIEDAAVELGPLAAGEIRFVILPDRGDASYTISIDGNEITGGGACQGYIEGDMYHLTVRIGPTEGPSGIGVECRIELGVFGPFMAREMLPALLH